MPLIMLCGGPLSGKSLITQKIQQKCKELYPDRECQVLSHETLNVSRLVFKDMPTEKKFNQKILSMVEQALTSRRVVIVDFICLTKSLRYQLYGKANFTGTVSCVVHCTTPYEITLERNKPMETGSGVAVGAQNEGFKKQFYTENIFEDLWNRLETPLDTCKWDYPCYPIDCSDLTSFLPNAPVGREDPNDSLWETILKSICENSKKNLSRANLPTRTESSGFVAVMDKITTAIVEQLIEGQQQQGFVVGALLETQSITVPVDISPFLALTAPTSPASATSPTSPTPASPDTNTSLIHDLDSMALDPSSPIPTTTEPTPTPTPTPSSGLKLVRKAVRTVKKPIGSVQSSVQSHLADEAQSPTAEAHSQTSPTASPVKTIYDITIKTPTTPSALFELKQSFSRIAIMMNVKTADQIVKAFVEYLQPQLNPM